MSIEDRKKQAGEWGPNDYAKTMYHFSEMMRDIHEMRRRKRVAMFDVDTKRFADSTIPYPQVGG